MNAQRLYPLSAWLGWVLILPLALLALGFVAAVWAARETLVFDHLEFWWLAAAVPASGLLFLYGVSRRRKAISQFASERLAPLLAQRTRPSRQALRAGLLTLAVVFLVGGIIGPRWGIYMEKQRVYGRDIVVALDVSRSMLAEDVPPNRFERAKREIRQQLTERGAFAQSNRLALLAFAGSTSLRVPLTTDTVVFRSKLEQLPIGAAPRGGTAIGDAIRASADLFAKSPPEAEKIIMLFTDGEDHEGGPVEAAREVWEKHGIRVYTIAVGDPSSAVGAQVPEAPGSNKPLLYEGQIVFSKLNADALRQIAQAGSGEYLPITELFRAVNKISAMKKAELSAEERMRHQPRYQWFVAAALLLLLIEPLVGELRKEEAEPMRVWQQEAA